MFSGIVSKCSERVVASAATITADADILIITGSVGIANIIPKVGGVACQEVTIIPLAALTLANTGNIAASVVCVIGRAQSLFYSRSQNKWYPQIAAV